MLYAFSVDVMQLVYTGVIKKLITLWLDLSRKRLESMTKTVTTTISESLLQCAENVRWCIYLESNGMLSISSAFKSDYTKKCSILPSYLNSLQLATSTYSLPHPKSCRVRLSLLGSNFLVGYKWCYGAGQLIYKIHLLKHIADDVNPRNVLDTHSFFLVLYTSDQKDHTLLIRCSQTGCLVVHWEISY